MAFCKAKWSASDNSSIESMMVVFPVGVVVVAGLAWQQNLVGHPRLVARIQRIQLRQCAFKRGR